MDGSALKEQIAKGLRNNRKIEPDWVDQALGQGYRRRDSGDGAIVQLLENCFYLVDVNGIALDEENNRRSVEIKLRDIL